MNNLTLISCSYNTPKITENMLKTFLSIHPNTEVLICENSTDDVTEQILKDANVPYIRNKGGLHGPSVDLLLDQVKTDNVLLVDTDVIFLKDHVPIYQQFLDMDLALMGEIVGDRGGKRLHKRVHPWHCFMSAKKIKQNAFKFYDEKRMRSRDQVRYDVGSSLFEDVKKKKLRIGQFLGNESYYKHYEGMSWRIQKYTSNKAECGDIDTISEAKHDELGLKQYGEYVLSVYLQQTKHLDKVKLNYGTKN